MFINGIYPPHYECEDLCEFSYICIAVEFQLQQTETTLGFSSRVDLIWRIRSRCLGRHWRGEGIECAPLASTASCAQLRGYLRVGVAAAAITCFRL